MAVTTLTLDPVVDVTINLSAISATRKAFNLALLMGNVGSIADFDDARIVTYASLDDMLTAGFTSTDRLYQAAALIFGQDKVPPNVAIGKISTAAIAGKNTYTITTNAATGDTITIGGVTLTAVASSAVLGTSFVPGANVIATATAIAASLNANTTFNAKYGATAASGIITITETVAGGGNTPGEATKTGTIVITSGTATTSTTRTETPLETITACREADWEWYVGIYCAVLTDDDIQAMAAYVEDATPATLLAYTTSESSALTDAGIFNTLKNLSYKRAIGQYSTKHEDAIAAIMGYAMGSMTGTINSAFTLAYKIETGVTTENSAATFAESKVTAITGYNGNVYINRGNAYNVFTEGNMAYGYWFDEMIFLDKMKNDIQMGVMDLLYDNAKIPQTESGMNQLTDAIKTVLDSYVKIGFVAAGQWNGNDILDLSNGDTLPNGYLIQHETMADQSQTDRDNRIAPNIYVAAKLAGAIQHVVIEVDVNR
ncbi:DUF3383 family protein [Megasphaera cerevisiae]|uniref:DUF3383 family protein n=1 Tax=Megasphaera cerevisiae TaxID=39029 RepID=UPI00069CE679|nr:DUF3383 family protein [Megasphaera cerevisiae]SJZ58685.1 Protein of unknown function [Megasphaera cerevisiae DSM 20462]